MKKMILMTANGMNLFEKDLEMLVQERDYRTIGQRLTEMEPQQASRWLARQDEQLRFAVACKMEPDKAEQICACTEQESRTGYLSSSAAALAKSRIFWLMALMISGMITGGILARYESAFAAVPMLVTFIPMLTDTGGNAGSQSSTIIIRAMTMGEIGFRNLIQVLWKEIRVGVLAGAALSAVNFFRLLLTTSALGRDCADCVAGDAADGSDGKGGWCHAAAAGGRAALGPGNHGGAADHYNCGCLCAHHVF